MMLVGWICGPVDTTGRTAARGSCDDTSARLSTFIDPSASFDGERLGAGSRVLAYVRVGPGTVVGENCTLHEHSVLIGAITLEKDVTVQTGAQLLGQVRVE